MAIKPPCCTRRYQSTYVAVLLTSLLFSPPFASPFAGAGSTANSAQQLKQQQQQQQQQPSFAIGLGKTPQTAPSTTRTTALFSKQTKDGTIPLSVTPFPVANSETNGTASIERWQLGEPGASFVSRLLFGYAGGLLNLAKVRRLEASDALGRNPKKTMDNTVPQLEQIYSRCRATAVAAASRRKVKNDDAASTNNSGGIRGFLTRRRDQKEWDGTSTNESRITATESIILAKAILLHQRKTLFFTGCLRLINTSIQAFPAILVSRLLRNIEAGDANPPGKALRAALALIAVLSTKMIVENQYFHAAVKCATQVRGSVAGLIFDKSLRLSGSSATSGAPSTEDETEKGNKKSKNNGDSSTDTTSSSADLGAGGVLNLMQSDASVLESVALQIHTIWDGVLQISMYTYLLFRFLGPSVLWGIGVLLLTIPVNSVTLRLVNRLSRFEYEAKDRRTKRTTESISNMKLLKLQAWENVFAEDIQLHRREELRRHVTRGAVRAFNQAVSNAVPALVLVVTLTAYSRTGQPLVASTIFTAISLFNQLRFPLFFYPMLIDSLANGKNALRRISSYLSREEIVPYVNAVAPPLGPGSGSIEMSNGAFLWSSSSNQPSSPSSDLLRANMASPSTPYSGPPALCGANLTVRPGEVVAVVGPVGSGKTALIKALLGELVPVPRMVVDHTQDDNDDINPASLNEVPAVMIGGSVAYCAQEAWLSKGTLREAVLFGRPYDEERYRSAIRDAGLDADIVEEGASSKGGALSHDTDVGEGGSSLSGGQRARVALARALYGSSEGVYLLDDPLAALDASVGSSVFERLTTRLHAQNAATILVTNDPTLPSRCDRVVLMGTPDRSISGAPDCSRIVDVGTYAELIARGHNLRQIGPSYNVDAEQKAVLGVEKEKDPVESDVARVGVDGPTKAEQPEITSSYKLESIHVVGDFELSNNDTIRTCHADPDCKVMMENHPDFFADQVIPVSPDFQGDNEILIGTDMGLSQVDEETNTSAENDAQVAESSDTTKTPADKSTVKGSLSSKSESKIAKTKKEKKRGIASADDAMTTGAIPLSTYITYMKAVRSPPLIAAMLASFGLVNGAQFFQQFIIAKWTELGGSAAMTTLASKYLNSLVYAAAVVSIFLWLRSFLTVRVGVRASELLHRKMLSSVFRAPMSFFDATPSGQLLSRFGKELETVDWSLPDGIGSVIFCFLQIATSGLALAGVVTPIMLLPLSVIGILYARTMGRFRPAARDMKRNESKTRSPIYTHFGEALRGAETIRSVPSGRGTWSLQHRHLSDENLSVFYSVKALDRWLSIRLETLGNIIVFTSAVASAFLTRAGRLNSGSAGWGLTQALSITGLLTWAVRCLTDLETQMMSVLRITEITDLESTEMDGAALPSVEDKIQKPSGGTMPRENRDPGTALEPLVSESTLKLPLAPRNDTALIESGWPWKGAIRFSNVSMRYSPLLPLVLKNVSIDVPPGSTLGVVGRTGSGKSSLLLTLFRLIEVESGGSIEIDGVDIRSIGLQTLRESLAIIPQDPVLFAGTIMYNLDATGRATREDAWKALEAASPDLARQFRIAGTGLDTVVVEGGKNLSLGQRQLLCLARALLRKSKILVLDEATSSVDSKTDAEVQATIVREFVNKGVTVMTVAHRLETVLGYDNIAVLGSGELIEYGPPSVLLESEGGELRSLVDAYNRNKLKGSIKDTREAVEVA